MPFLEGAGVALRYEVIEPTGPVSGHAAVLVHGLAADRRSHAAAAGRLAALGLRTVVYDRRGYGESGAPEPYFGTTVQEQAQDLIAVLSELDVAPALLVGLGFGALIALDVVCREPALVRGAVLVDTPVFPLVPEANQALAEQRLRLEDALRDGGPAAAVAGYLGPGAEPAELARAQAAERGFFADYAGLASWPVSRAVLRAVRPPVAVLASDGAPPEIRLAADRLAELVPGATEAPAGELADVARAVVG